MSCGAVQKSILNAGGGESNDDSPVKTVEPCEIRSKTTQVDTIVSSDEASPEKRDHGSPEAPQEITSLTDVYQALDSLDSEGSACTGGIATELPAMPGLVVEGVGEIFLPLNQENATKLKAAARQAPHGRGMETIIDKSVRDTMQVDADQVTLTNPVWSAGIKGLTRKVCTALGVNPDLVRSELYKLLLYEEGGFFKKHRDTEKADGMFATLVVQLPSRFTGGSFVVTHNGSTKEFSMEDSKTSPYCCHYVGHYADCEHEILPIESGYRVALIYSLCYTGKEVSKPSVANVQEGSLVSVMQRLDKSQSLFAIPMDHQYTTVSLARLGVGALKGQDRSLARTIGHVEGWELMVVKLERTDCEDLCPFDGLEVMANYRGDVCLKEIFCQDGRDGKEQANWLKEQLNFDSVKQGGNLLTENRDGIWGEGDVGAVQYTGNEGTTRDTTYSACVLIAYSKDGVFERLCRTNFPKAMNMIPENPKLLDRALEYIHQSKPSISSDDFLAIHPLIQGTDSYWSSFDMLLQGLKSRSEVPSSSVTSLFSSMIKDHGWNNEQMAPLRLFLEQLVDLANRADCEQLVSLIKTFFAVKEVLPDKSHMESLIQKTLGTFDAATGNFAVRRHMRRPRFPPYLIYHRLEALAKLHGWKSVASLVTSCFSRIRKSKPCHTKLGCILAGQINAIESLSKNVPGVPTQSLRESVRKFLLTVIRQDEVWLSPEIGKLVEDLYRYGTPAMFQRVEGWASKAALFKVSIVHAELQKLESTTHKTPSRYPQAKDHCVAHVHQRFHDMKRDELKRQEHTLLEQTRVGEPVFSWSMPQAKTRSDRLNAFLHSDQEGPCEICLAKGLENARSFSRDGGLISQGYSATIKVTDKTGEKASVIVTKTKKLYETQFQRYHANLKDLAQVRADLEQLDDRPRPSTREEPPAKRARGSSNER